MTLETTNDCISSVANAILINKYLIFMVNRNPPL